MNRLARMSACLAAGTLACSALAQPSITSLGSGTPLSVTDSLGGTYYIGGSGVGGSGAGRWALTGGILTMTGATGSSGGGQIAKGNGEFLTSLVVNGPTRWAIGNVATGVSPAFNAPSYANPASLTASATQPAATEFGGARWSYLSSSHTTMGTVPIIGFTPNPNPAPVSISTITCLSGVATATTSAAHGLAVDDIAIIASNSTSGYNGVVKVTGVPSATQFTYSVNCGANGTGGSVTKRVLDIGTSGVYGTGSSGGSTGSFLSPQNISANGRFIVGQNYVCVYNTAGTSISDNSFYWRPVIWDADGNAGAGSLTVLPTPFRTSNASEAARTRRRTGNPYAVSNDGLVVVGATEHNVATTPNADADGGRLVVWRRASTSDPFSMSYLDTGVDANGFPNYTTSTPSNVAMNSGGTIIAARTSLGITKWVWNGSSWGTPIVIGSNFGATTPIATASCSGGIVTVTTSSPHGLAVNATINISGNLASGPLPFGSTGFNGYYTVTNVIDSTTFEYMVTSCPLDTGNNQITGTGGNVNLAASWIPFSVRSCGQPPNLGAILTMSDDGNVIGGSATYSTCGSFMQGGFIWHASDGLIKDWYDYNVAQGTPGCGTGQFYGPIGDNMDASRGLPVIGNPIGISPDGTAIVGRQGGNQLIPGAPPWIWQATGGPSCVPPVVTLNPTPSVLFSRCSVSPTVNSVILNANAAGSGTLSYQWFRGATPLVDGPTGSGSSITGATSFQLRILTPGPSDAGNYHCVITGCTGLTATTTSSMVAPDPAMPIPANDQCSGAITIGEGTTNFNICGAYVTDGAATCLPLGTTEVADVWYRYVPTFTGFARIQTCGSSYDTTLQAYDSGGCSGNILACNNDVGSRGVAGIGSACAANRAVIEGLPVTMGEAVYIRVGAIGTPFTNSNTTGALTITQAPPAPANDLCENAINVTANSTTPFDLSNATDDYTFGIANGCSLCPNDTQTASNRDVWFRLVAPCGGTFVISTCGSTITNPMIQVFEDDCFAGNLIRCSDNVGSGVTGCTSNQAGIGVGTCGTNGTPLTITGSVLIRVSVSGTGSPGTAANAGQGVLIVTGTTVQCQACCDVFNNCTMVAPDNCVGTLKVPGSMCTPDACDAGACCCGSTCLIVSRASCIGPNTSFVAGGACEPYSLTAPCCRGDFNKVGGITVQDIFDFLTAYFTPNICSDSNNSTGITVQDIFDFLSAYFGGC